MNRELVVQRLREVNSILIDPIRGDERHAGVENPTPAAVLIAIVPRADGPNIILTKRTDHLKDHAGQISFPGGRRDPGDQDSVATALREANEEIGLDPVLVDVLGHMPSYRTVTGYVVEPVVGWVERPNVYKPDPFEVAEVFEVPLSFIADPANHKRDSRLRNGERRYFYVLPYFQHYIWGATAGMLVNFARLLTEGRS